MAWKVAVDSTGATPQDEYSQTEEQPLTIKWQAAIMGGDDGGAGNPARPQSFTQPKGRSGMYTVERDTQASGLKYTIQLQQFEDAAEMAAEICRLSDEQTKAIRAALSPFEEVLKPLVGVGNAAQEQGAKQGAKEPIRKAIRAHGPDSDEAQAEIDAHKKRSVKYLIGAPRGSTSGLGKTKAAKVGKALLEKVGEEQLASLAAEYGIDVTELE